VNEPAGTEHRGLALLLLGVAVAGVMGGLAALGLGIHCYTQPNPGADCAVLTAAVPLTTWPLAAAAGIFAFGLAGRLMSSRLVDPETATANPESGAAR